MTKQVIFYCALISGLLLSGCANTVKYGEQSATEATTTEISSGDLQSAALKMINQLLADPKIKDATLNKRPVLAVFGVVDFSGDNIDLARINNNILNQLNKSNRFRFSRASDLIEEHSRLNPDIYDLVEQPETAEALTKALSADYLLIGEVSKVIRRKPTNKEIYYRLTLKLLQAASGDYAWQGKEEFLFSQQKIVYGI